MIYPKQLLEELILDAIGGYILSVSKVHPQRQKQIDTIKQTCSRAKFDVTILNVVKRLVGDMDIQATGWIIRKPSQLAIMLRHSVDAYERLMSLQAQQPTQPILRPVKQKELPVARIQAEAKQLMVPKVLALPAPTTKRPIAIQ